MKSTWTLLNKITLALLLLNNSFATSQKRACINALQPLEHQGLHAPLLPVGIQALLPSHKFSCAGRIHSWGVVLSGRGQRGMHMQVWRPVPDEPGKYVLVGDNYFNAVVRFGEKILFFQPDEDRQISVESGDVVGFYLQDDAQAKDEFRVQYRTNMTSSTVVYEHYAAPPNTLHLDRLTNQLTNAAPSITVYLDKISAPTQSSLLSSEATPTAPPTTATTQSVSEAINETTKEPPTEKPTTTTPATPTTTPATPTITSATPTTTPAAPATTHVTPITPAMPPDILLVCVVTTSVILGLVLLTLVATLLYARVQRRRNATSTQPEKGEITTAAPHEPDLQDSISTTPLTENPAYGSTHNGLVASLTWLPKAKQGKLQVWKAQYYETPIISSGSAKRSQKLEGSYHHYDTPVTLLASNHHYEQI